MRQKIRKKESKGEKQVSSLIKANKFRWAGDFEIFKRYSSIYKNGDPSIFRALSSAKCSGPAEE
jgi:hypothetical protein